MTVNVAISGAMGKMGQALIRQLPDDMHLVAAYIRKPCDASLSATDHTPYSVRPDSPAEPIDVLIDFTSPEHSLDNAKWCAKHQIALVTGSTGFSQQQWLTLKQLGEQTRILWSANTSLGIQLIAHILPTISQVLHQADIEIIEAHHRDKRDAPSGTALFLGNVIKQALKTLAIGRTDQLSRQGKRAPQEIGYHAIRGGDIVGEHQILFASPGERLELHHKVTDRDTFAKGALIAGRWLAKQTKPGLYSMQDLFDLNNALNTPSPVNE